MEFSGLNVVLLFTTGLLTSFGHCVGMCGGIVTAYAVQQRRLRAGGSGGLGAPLLRYHAGRLTSYALIGSLFALFGGLVLRVLGDVARVQGWLSFTIGLLMVALGLGLLGVLPTRRWVEGSGLGGPVVKTMGRLLAARRARGQFGLGLVNGFLPCGPVYAVALNAAALSGPAGSLNGLLPGALAMLIFGLGTVPALLLLGFGASGLSVALRSRLFRLAGLLVILIGLQLALRGLGALGLIAHLTWGPVMLW